MEFASHLNKKILLPGVPGVMLCELDMWDPWRDDCLLNMSKEGKIVLKGSCFTKTSARHSAGHR